jgi:hypothetical protein
MSTFTNTKQEQPLVEEEQLLVEEEQSLVFKIGKNNNPLIGEELLIKKAVQTKKNDLNNSNAKYKNSVHIDTKILGYGSSKNNTKPSNTESTNKDGLMSISQKDFEGVGNIYVPLVYTS